MLEGTSSSFNEGQVKNSKTEDNGAKLIFENLEKALEITIFDRTYVILEIFKSRAKTKATRFHSSNG